ncbi:MAG: hypothetical protein M1147_10100 [Nitrospirae bacterium]|nr:hypothetical protein [Nitrospirota bacterium]MCL5978446.1 hypothetical protein [Nitrospirota bacterium]
MKILFKILKSGFTDKLAYSSALLAAAWWIALMRYPAVILIPSGESGLLYAAMLAAFAGGLLIAKYVFMHSYLLSIEKLNAGKRELETVIMGLKKDIFEVVEERDRISGRERLLESRLRIIEEKDNEYLMSALRKRIRSYEEDIKAALAFFIKEMNDCLDGAEISNDEDIIHAADVLRKEILLLEGEIKRGEMSFYEIILKIAEIRENIFELAFLKTTACEQQKENTGHYGACCFDAETDPARIERMYKFFKVAFHPDRFSSELLKEEAKLHFQETIRAYDQFRERVRTSL